MNRTIQTSEYLDLQDDAKSDADLRRERYETVTNNYYDLVTDFFLFGWGDSFHFARRQPGDTFRRAVERQQLHLASCLDLRPGMRVIDLGCGVGGPLRTIAQATGAHVIGINNNDYQLGKARRMNARKGLSDRCELVKADFMELPFAGGEIDAAYAIEATCHAPDHRALFREIRRVLRPGGMFASYEWCMTERYDPRSTVHYRVKRSIERGDGLPDLKTIDEVRDAAREAGFEVIQMRDLVADCDPSTPWYLPLTGADRGLGSLTRRPTARALTRRVVALLERLKLAPKGSKKVSDMLNEAADALVEAGELGIFTPMALLVARNPA